MPEEVLPTQSRSSSEAFSAVLGVRRGVPARTGGEQEQADARDEVANDVDAFLSAHGDHGSAIEFRHHLELPGQPGSLVCCRCDPGVHAPMSDIAVAVERFRG